MENKRTLKGFFTGRKGRKIRENLTGYLFIAPSTLLIFIFGIFPVFFALYVSLHKWRIKRTEMVGLNNYVDAIGNLAYVLVFFLAIGALVGVYFLLKRTLKLAREKEDKPWITILPGLAHAGLIVSFFYWIYNLLPEVLGIADKLRGLERTQDVFMGLLRDAFRAESVLPSWHLFLWMLLASVVLAVAGGLLWRNRRNATYQMNFALVFLAFVIGIGLLYFTYQQVALAYTAAMETGTDPGIWPQFISISGGMILLLIAWFLWQNAGKQLKGLTFWVRIGAALILLVGAWLLIGEIPSIVASGDKDLWEGLKVTVFFSLGTVPWQLALSLVLAVILFQKVKGSNIFRIIFFIPYVTPAIASAVVFQQMFSNRQSAPVNMLLTFLGIQPQQWLFEPKGIITIIGNSLGWNVPAWAAGPSLALIVIMLHSIWTYVGYDTVIYLAGLGNISRDLYDSAEVDGANKWHTFWGITFPLLSPTTYFLSLIAIIGTFKAFNTIWILRSNMALGSTDTFSVTIFIEFFEKLRYGYASAMAFILFAIILILSFINNRVQGSRVFYG
jgi:multiple sugar transport system permease protein